MWKHPIQYFVPRKISRYLAIAYPRLVQLCEISHFGPRRRRTSSHATPAHPTSGSCSLPIAQFAVQMIPWTRWAIFPGVHLNLVGRAQVCGTTRENSPGDTRTLLEATQAQHLDSAFRVDPLSAVSEIHNGFVKEARHRHCYLDVVEYCFEAHTIHHRKEITPREEVQSSKEHALGGIGRPCGCGPTGGGGTRRPFVCILCFFKYSVEQDEVHPPLPFRCT